MDIVVKRRTPGSPAAAPQKIAPPSLFDKHFGEWGKVKTVHSEDNTIDVLLASGVFLNRVPVASKEWVISGEDAGKDYNSGERNLPPVHARVFIMMPSFTYHDCFVAPFSGFSTIDQPAPYMEDDREKIKEKITPSGWHVTDDYVTGRHKAVSPDKKTSLEIDYGAEQEPKEDDPELHLKLFDNITIDVTADEKIEIGVFDTDYASELVKGESYTVNIFDGEHASEHIKGKSYSANIFDANIRITQGEVAIKTDGNIRAKIKGRYYVGNDVEDICALLLALTDELIGFQTFGHPALHKTHPQTIAKLVLFKAKIKSLFLESA